MSLPDELRAVLPADTANSWMALAPLIPAGAYLVGGTALAMHLHHRVSLDLDFFFDEDIDLDVLERELRAAGPFAVIQREPGTLNGIFAATNVQFLSAIGQRRLERTTNVAGIEVAGIADIFATKLKVIGDRGELRDYFDLMAIERQTKRTVEEALGLYMARYDVTPEDASIRHIISALGHLDDVAEDTALGASHNEIAEYWRRRQPQVIRHLARFPSRGG